MKELIIGILCVFLFSCVEKESKNVQEQELKTLSRIHFDDLVGKGMFLRNNFPIGLWRYYDSKKRLLEVKQFIDIKNSPYLNQNWTFDIKGDTIPDLSYYYEIFFEKDTISLKDPVKALVNLKEAFFKDQPSSIMVLIPQKKTENFNSDFSNISKVLKDTIFNLNTEKEYREQGKLEGDYRRSAFFGRYFDTGGLKKIRGIIVEFNSDGKFSDDTNADYKEHYYYFEKDIFVKD